MPVSSPCILKLCQAGPPNLEHYKQAHLPTRSRVWWALWVWNVDPHMVFVEKHKWKRRRGWDINGVCVRLLSPPPALIAGRSGEEEAACLCYCLTTVLCSASTPDTLGWNPTLQSCEINCLFSLHWVSSAPFMKRGLLLLTPVSKHKTKILPFHRMFLFMLLLKNVYQWPTVKSLHLE